MIVGEFHVGDIAATLQLQVREGGEAVDLSGVTAKQFRLRNPHNDPPVYVEVSFVTDGSDGWVQWITTAETDLDAAGEWQAQPYFEGLDGWSGHTESVAFHVTGLI